MVIMLFPAREVTYLDYVRYCLVLVNVTVTSRCPGGGYVRNSRVKEERKILATETMTLFQNALKLCSR